MAPGLPGLSFYPGHYPEGWVRSVFALFDSQYRREPASPYKGYLVTNKPMYQPGDTVRYKAFVTNKAGQPIRKKAILQVSNYEKPAKILGEVKPYRPGAYAGSFVLTDSLNLELDRAYTLAFLKKGRSKKKYSSNTFKYEDYELQENKYTLDLKYDKHPAGRMNSLIARGTNANGLNLLDAQVEITIVTGQVKQTQEPEVFIPDTLWVHQQPLEAVGETTILIPDKIFPRASLDYTVTATFRTANNELSTLARNATYEHTNENLKISLLQDSLLVQYQLAGAEKSKTARLIAYNPDDDEITAIPLQLPARLPLNAFAASYEVVVDSSLRADLDLSETEALVSLHTSRVNDSVFFKLQNPRRLPYWYFVYRGEKLAARGQGKEAHFFLQRPAPGGKPYFVAVRYLWAGEMQQLEEAIPLAKHLLSLNLEAPSVIYPGQATNLTVQVKNAAGKPASGVDVTAYAITAKFKEPNIPTIPSWDRYKKQKPYRRLTKEEISQSDQKLLDWNYWRYRLGLDSMAYYQFLYPEKGLFTEYSVPRDSITQVSPFVVDSGRVVPVHIVYLDEVPVYFSQTDVLPAYSFAADSGFHTIKLRTSDKLITLDKVYLKHQHKLILSADITTPNPLLTQVAQKSSLSGYEQNRLSQYLFWVNHKSSDTLAYLKQGNRIHLLTRNTDKIAYYPAGGRETLLAGPFRPLWMQYVRLHHFTTNFELEAGYQYYFAPQLLKMQEYKLPREKIMLPIWNKGERKPELLYQEALTPRRIEESWEAAQYERFLQKIYTTNGYHAGKKNTGKLGWTLESAMKQDVKLVLLHKVNYPDSLRVYAANNSLLFNLEPAAYVLTLALTKGDFLTAQVNVKPNGQTQVHFKKTQVASSAQSKYLLQLVAEKIEKFKKTTQTKAEDRQLQLQTAHEITYSLSNGSAHYNHLVTGVVQDNASGEGLPGVTVVLKGTTTGTTTNYNGRYEIYVPANGTLTFSFIGYVTAEVNIHGRDEINAKLNTDAKALQEVVVIGYSFQERKVLTGAVATQLQGRAAGILIRGAATVKAENARPLLLVDGVPYSGAEADIKNIVSKKILSSTEAMGLYGSVGTAGVILITTKKGTTAGNPTEQELQPINAIRSNFSDYAFWQPRLVTDKKGEVHFKTTFPDDITQWNAYVIGMDAKKRSGIYSTSINSFKAMMATLHVPRFLVEGDRTTVLGKALNYLPDSVLVTTQYQVGGVPGKKFKKLLQKSFTDTLQITAPAHGADSLEVQYSLQQPSGFTDGEKRYIPVYARGVEEKTGWFLPLSADTTFTLNLDPAKGPVRLSAQSHVLPVLLEEIDYLHHYEYWCSEQAASKLKGLLLEKQIRAHLGQPFEHDRMVRRLIRHLEKTQLSTGPWTWWQNGPAYSWITAHVLEALVMAKNAKYPVKYQEQKLTDYLVDQLEKAPGLNKLTSLETLHQLQAKVDYNRYVQELQKKKKPTLEEQLRLTRLQQKLQLPAPLDTLQKYQQQTMLGSMYWGKAKYSLFDNNITNTLLAYEILKTAGNHERELTKIRAYLLSERRAGHWRNTYESAKILETLLPDLLPKGSAQSGRLNAGLSFSGGINLAMQESHLDTTFILTQPVTVKKQGKLPLYFTAYQITWNQAPEPVSKDFILTTFLNKAKDKATLTAGKPAEMRVEVEVKADADYVMLEVPIPAGCSYESKTEKSAYEEHRQYHRHKVSIFCAQLPKGKYTFTIQLLPRYTGTYTLNPAKAELMYFPTFFGRNRIKQVQVK
ncbi:carboxypeptidase-like regulatory domain-containing protein [Adhaeribacter pallidiroseus]|uniref:Alpha-2-macroglobulin domain-containing protein n=1 Tax=Adhaeribacter pallidiroseus TaxID=2072847 RepID=A0A369QL04_9BACT|nr:carboxypeptidase-like regulatory domain-containing protein [Adhaeribacter pallidiroseus]RDC65603.1 hypothetical protein AHMF7616_04233 [Adhaeribacter pallidiroseus]